MNTDDKKILLVEYLSGKMLPERMIVFRRLIDKDAALKQEVSDMQSIWNSLESKIPMDEKHVDKMFYDALHTAKLEMQDTKIAKLKYLSLIFRFSLVTAACILMFVLGRITVKTKEITHYKFISKNKKDNSKVFENKENISKNNITLFKTNRRLVKSKPSKHSTISPYASERIFEILNLDKGKYELSQTNILQLIKAMNTDSNQAVRLIAISKLESYINLPQVQQAFIKSLEQQGNDLVRISLLDVLINAKVKQAIAPMLAVSESTDTDLATKDKISSGIDIILY